MNIYDGLHEHVAVVFQASSALGEKRKRGTWRSR